MNASIVLGARPLYRSVFISDTHLGTRGARCDFLADFLRRTSCQHLFLVGDIFDGWRLRKSWYWDEQHDEVLRQILRHARGGTAVTYIPGNHDEMFRAWLDPFIPGGLEIAGIRLLAEAEHVTVDGKRLLIMHGDEFDSVVRYAKFLALLGDWAYSAALDFNRWFNAVRRRLGYPYWSLSAWLKRQVKEAVKAIDRFENALAVEARRRGFDGVVCGHIHQAEIRDLHGVLYLNDGDWVESCTALVEHYDGRLELIDWAAANRLSFFAPSSATLREAADTTARHAPANCDAMLPPALSHRILIVTDAWSPQVNGVVRTLTTVVSELRAMGHAVEVISPDQFRTIPCPTYTDIPLALLPRRRLVQMIDAFKPEAMHISTEGPLGMAARSWAMRNGFNFTTAFHTRFAEYIKARTGLPVRPVYAWMRRFHSAARGTMVATQSLRDELARRGFRNIRSWSRGVDLDQFKPKLREEWGLTRPVFLSVGRVAVEKNVGAFLDLDLPGSKVVVGDGPILSRLHREYPNVLFTGARYGEALARAYAGADVFVFPSLTDTFGLVLLESLACGTPIAAHPVTGPIDVLADAHGKIGAVNVDLRTAALEALTADRAACRAHAERYSWRACAEIFLSHLVPMAS